MCIYISVRVCMSTNDTRKPLTQCEMGVTRRVKKLTDGTKGQFSHLYHDCDTKNKIRFSKLYLIKVDIVFISYGIYVNVFDVLLLRID